MDNEECSEISDIENSGPSEIEDVPGKSRSSTIWECYRVDKTKPSKVICKLCQVSIYRGTGKNVTTKSMWNHVKAKHVGDFKRIQEVKQKADQTQHVQGSRKKSVQLSLLETLDRTKVWDIADPRSSRIHKLIGEMIAVDMQPFSFVEDFGFRRLMAAALPSYKVPGRTYFTENVCPDILRKVKDVVKDKIRRATWVSFTSDIWTAEHSNNSFLSLTAHWINSDFERDDALVTVHYLNSTSHTGDCLKTEIKTKLVEWDLLRKVHLFVTDNGRNMVNAMEGTFNWIPCFLHTLHLIVKDAIKSQRSVKDMVQRCVDIAGHFHHSAVATLALQKIQKRLNSTCVPKKMLQHTSTRWNSLYYMLLRIYELKTALTVFATENGKIKLPTSNEWSLLPSMISLLKPFEELTVMYSSNESVISDVIPSVAVLRNYLTKSNPAHHGVGTMKAELLKSLNSRFVSIEDNELYSIATFLDPRYKASCFTSEEIVETVKHSIIDQLLHHDTLLAAQKDSDDASGSAHSQNHSNRPLNVVEDASDTIWGEFEEIKKIRLDITPPTTEDIRRRVCLTEVDNYLATNVSPMFMDTEHKIRSNPLNLWQKCNFCSGLKELARKYLSAPPSSAESERAFSEAGLVCTDHRSRLTPENAEMLVFLHHNLPRIKFMYD